MTGLHDQIKKKKQHIDCLKEQANRYTMERVRIETELSQHQKIEESYLQQMKELGYNSPEEVSQAIEEKGHLLDSVIAKLDAMVSGQVEDEMPADEVDDFEF